MLESSVHSSDTKLKTSAPSANFGIDNYALIEFVPCGNDSFSLLTDVI